MSVSTKKVCAPATKPKHRSEADEEEIREELSEMIIESLTALWSYVRVLDLSYSNINSTVIDAICESCHQLEALNLAHCEAIGGSTQPAFFFFFFFSLTISYDL
jgi:hypothetical protein